MTTITTASIAVEEVGVESTASSWRTYSADGAWCWFGDPRAVRYVGTRTRTFFGWISRLGDILVAQYDHGDRSTATSTLAIRMVVDDHSNPSLIVLPDGRLMAFWSGHVGPTMFHRVSTNPESVLSWGPTRQLPVQLPGQVGYTYPNPVWIPQENRLYLFWRGGSQPAVSWSDDLGGTWAPARQIAAAPGERPYVKVAGDGHGGIHIVLTDGHPDEVSVNDTHYVRLYRGDLWRADSTRVGSLASGAVAVDSLDKVCGQSVLGYKTWVHDVAAAPDGTPVVVLAAFPSPTDHRYRYARWTPTGGWTNRPVTLAGPASETSGTQPYYSGGIVLDHADPGVMYLSRKIGAVFEIERWMTRDGGVTFTHTAVTSGSAQNNVRPFVTRGAAGGPLGLLWMAGDYPSYTTYATGIRGTPDPTTVRQATRLRSSLTPMVVSPGQSVVVGGRLVVDDTGAAIPTEPLELWVRQFDQTEWTYLVDGTTDATGLVQWTRAPAGDADYQVRYRGDSARLPAVSPGVRVDVRYGVSHGSWWIAVGAAEDPWDTPLIQDNAGPRVQRTQPATPRTSTREPKVPRPAPRVRSVKRVDGCCRGVTFGSDLAGVVRTRWLYGVRYTGGGDGDDRWPIRPAVAYPARRCLDDEA